MFALNMKKEIKDNQFQKFKYKQIKSLKTQFSCSLFGFDINSFILFAGCMSEGIVQAFALNNQLKLIKTLINTQQRINILICMEKSKYLIYVSNRKGIFISKLNQNFQLTIQYNLQAHTGKIISLLTNEEEDLLISGSVDGKIKFWKKDNLIWSHLQTIDALMDIYKLSLNSSETKIIACDQRKLIKIFELQPNQKWSLFYVIQSGGKQLCFINDNQFFIQYLNTQYLEIYNYDEQKKQYIQSQQIYLSDCECVSLSFTPQFITEKNILIVKQGLYIDFLGIDQNGNYKKQQSNEYEMRNIYGKVTNNGRFLVTGASCSKQLQLSTYQPLD